MGVMSCESQYEMCLKKNHTHKNLFRERKEVSEYLAKQVIFKLRENRIMEISKILWFYLLCCMCDFLASH